MFTMLSNIYNYLKGQKLAEMKGERWDSPFMVHFQIQSEVTFLEIQKYRPKYVKRGAYWRKERAKGRVWGDKAKRGCKKGAPPQKGGTPSKRRHPLKKGAPPQKRRHPLKKGGTPSESLQFGNSAYCRLKLQPSCGVYWVLYIINKIKDKMEHLLNA